MVYLEQSATAWRQQLPEEAPARDFDFTVSVVSESSEYTEVVITEDDTEEGKSSDTWSLKDWLPAIIGVSAVIVVAVVLLLRRRSRS